MRAYKSMTLALIQGCGRIPQQQKRFLHLILWCGKPAFIKDIKAIKKDRVAQPVKFDAISVCFGRTPKIRDAQLSYSTVETQSSCMSLNFTKYAVCIHTCYVLTSEASTACYQRLGTISTVVTCLTQAVDRQKFKLINKSEINKSIFILII